MAIGKVIKGEGAPEAERASRVMPKPARAGVVNAEVYEAHQTAQQIIAAAEQKAQELIAAAEEQAQGIRAQAAEAGRQEGLAQVTELCVRAKRLAPEVLERAEHEIVALALKVAEKLIGRDLERSPEVVVDLCANAVETVRNAHSIVMRVNPADAQILRDRKPRLMELIGRLKEITIKEDSDVQRWGCILETDAGVIDAQLSTQLEMLQNLLLVDSAKKEGPA
jgi:type III secretion protein L